MAGMEEEGEVIALREALRQQTYAVARLKAELEEERQAAASSVDEALDMILRLQAEKAAERMQAEQFRRVAEERIQHDADLLAFLEAVVFHQEDISSLRTRLMAVCGCDDADAPDAVDLPWIRRLIRNGVPSRRNASLFHGNLLQPGKKKNYSGAGLLGSIPSTLLIGEIPDSLIAPEEVKPTSWTWTPCGSLLIGSIPIELPNYEITGHQESCVPEGA